MGPAVFSPGVKRPGREADHSSPSNTEIKDAWTDTSTTPYVFMAGCFIKHRENCIPLLCLPFVILRNKNDVSEIKSLAASIQSLSYTGRYGSNIIMISNVMNVTMTETVNLKTMEFKSK
jgi:hypothetical protein